MLVLVLVLFFTKQVRNEGFGMSAGTMDQLASTRVEMYEDIPKNTKEKVYDVNRSPNQDVMDMIQSNLVKQGLNNMTGVEAYQEEDPVFAKLYENLNYA
jgi:hypothetical protein